MRIPHEKDDICTECMGVIPKNEATFNSIVDGMARRTHLSCGDRINAAIGCVQCGTYEKHEPCPDCGQVQHMGGDYRCPHEPAFKSTGFEPFFNYGLGQWVTGVGDIKAACRPKWENDHVIKLEERG